MPFIVKPATCDSLLQISKGYPFGSQALVYGDTKKAQNLKLKSISTNNNFYNIFILIPSSSRTPRCTKGNPLAFIVLLTNTLYRKGLHYLRIGSCLAWALEISDRCRLLSSQPRVTVCCRSVKGILLDLRRLSMVALIVGGFSLKAEYFKSSYFCMHRGG